MDIKSAHQQYDCRVEIEKCLGEPRAGMWCCPFHEDRKPSFTAYKDGYHCFGCNAHGDVFDWFSFWTKRPLAEVLRDHRIDPMEEVRRKAEYAEHAAKRLEAEIERAQKTLAELRSAQAWMRYHENLTEESRALWLARGVPEWFQNFSYLGYDGGHRFWAGEQEFISPTLTFPVYEPVTREVLNVRHRLLGEASERFGKYRPERSGLPASPYVASPDLPVKNRVVVVEGEIKAMVVYATLEDENTQVVGLPGKGNFTNPKFELFEFLKDADPVYIIPDPDADPAGLIKRLDGKRVRVVSLPAKIDDAIVDNGLDKTWLRGTLNGARKL